MDNRWIPSGLGGHPMDLGGYAHMPLIPPPLIPHLEMMVWLGGPLMGKDGQNKRGFWRWQLNCCFSNRLKAGASCMSHHGLHWRLTLHYALAHTKGSKWLPQGRHLKHSRNGLQWGAIAPHHHTQITKDMRENPRVLRADHQGLVCLPLWVHRGHNFKTTTQYG